MREYRAGNERARLLNRWQNRTRSRALERLADEYPKRFAAILADERAKGPNPYEAS